MRAYLELVSFLNSEIQKYILSKRYDIVESRVKDEGEIEV